MNLTKQTLMQIGLIAEPDQAFMKIHDLRSLYRENKINVEEAEIRLIHIVVNHSGNQSLVKQKEIVSKVLDLILKFQKGN